MIEHPMSIVFSNLYGEEAWDEDGSPVLSDQVEVAESIANNFKANNPGLFKTQVWEHGLRVVGEISVVTDYVYRLRDAGLGDYIELWGSNDWLDAYGSNFPDPRKPPEPSSQTYFVYKYHYDYDTDFEDQANLTIVYEYLRENGYPNAVMSVEPGREYPDGELGEKVIILTDDASDYIEKFAAEYRRRYSNYDSLLERQPELPHRPEPAPELEERLWYFDSDYIPDVQTTLSQIRFNAIDRGFTNVVEYPEDPESWMSAEYAWIVPIRMAPEAHDWLAAGHPGAYFAVDDIRPWKG